MRPQNGNRVLVGIITARSSELATEAAGLTYTVQVDDGGTVSDYQAVKPGPGYRITDFSHVPADLLLIPFLINQEVPVAVQVAGNEDRMNIMAGEHLNVTPCP